jgi:aspartyl-tRNA(Asn)/glutamyl-tRNA(Gln) amidotransferase subunit A
MTDDIAFMPATRLLALYRSGQLSPVEVIEHILLRLETYESAIDAFVLYDPETALAMARASEARWQKGEPQGLLDGVPVALKDTLLTRGWPRLLGSRTIDPNQAWDEDAPVPGRLRANGAVFFGKTTTPEFGWKGVTDSPLSGVTRNPWNLERTPGGSSGGSAAAVLAGISPLAAGTDSGGSIRIPAAFCGIVGHKPTFGRVAAYPPSAFGDVAHVGPLTRTVDDAAMMLDAMKGPDSRDWHSLPMTGSLIASASAKARSRASGSRCRRPWATPSPRRRSERRSSGPPRSSPKWALSSKRRTRSRNRRCRFSRRSPSAVSGHCCGRRSPKPWR